MKYDDFTIYFVAFNHSDKELTPEEKKDSALSREGLYFILFSYHLPQPPPWIQVPVKACSSSHTTTGLNQTLTSKDTPMGTLIQAKDSVISPLASKMSIRLVSDSTNLVSNSRNDQWMVKWRALHLFWTLMGELFNSITTSLSHSWNRFLHHVVIGLRSFRTSLIKWQPKKGKKCNFYRIKLSFMLKSCPWEDFPIYCKILIYRCR